MLTSPFADAPGEAPPAPAGGPPPAEQDPPGTDTPAAAPQASAPRRSLLEWLEGWMPGAGSARLPSIATVRAYHKAGQYVPWEAGLIAWPARAHGWAAVCWATACTCMAWAGAGAYRRRIRTLWSVGVPGLLRAQLPPLDDLSGVPRAWVACWSVAGWLGLKFWRMPMAALYLLGAVLPLIV